jgi:putative transposase
VTSVSTATVTSVSTATVTSIDNSIHYRYCALSRSMRSSQRVLQFPNGWGGKRKGAGRPRHRSTASHRARRAHLRRQPVHVTLRARRPLPSLRRQAIFAAIRRTFPLTARAWFRLVHFSVQSDHVHLIVEADDQPSLSRGMAGVAIRMARAVNRVLRRRGSIWACRYHSRALTTPREVRNALVYVIFNVYKHDPTARGLDMCSSAPWFQGWETPPTTGPPFEDFESRPVRRPETWLARTGWKRHGLIHGGDAPRPGRARLNEPSAEALASFRDRVDFLELRAGRMGEADTAENVVSARPTVND